MKTRKTKSVKNPQHQGVAGNIKKHTILSNSSATTSSSVLRLGRWEGASHRQHALPGTIATLLSCVLTCGWYHNGPYHCLGASLPPSEKIEIQSRSQCSGYTSRTKRSRRLHDASTIERPRQSRCVYHCRHHPTRLCPSTHNTDTRRNPAAYKAPENHRRQRADPPP